MKIYSIVPKIIWRGLKIKYLGYAKFPAKNPVLYMFSLGFIEFVWCIKARYIVEDK